MKILVVDDEYVQRQLLRKKLTEWGHSVVEAENGDDAWKMLREKRDLEVLLSDWMMPGLEGPELCAMIRREPRESYLFIIMITSRSNAASFAESMSVGADAFLAKPIHFSELKSRLEAGQRVIDRENVLSRKILEALRGVREGVSAGFLAQTLAEDKRDVERVLERLFNSGEAIRDESGRYLGASSS